MEDRSSVYALYLSGHRARYWSTNLRARSGSTGALVGTWRKPHLGRCEPEEMVDAWKKKPFGIHVTDHEFIQSEKHADTQPCYWAGLGSGRCSAFFLARSGLPRSPRFSFGQYAARQSGTVHAPASCHVRGRSSFLRRQATPLFTSTFDKAPRPPRPHRLIHSGNVWYLPEECGPSQRIAEAFLATPLRLHYPKSASKAAQIPKSIGPSRHSRSSSLPPPRHDLVVSIGWQRPEDPGGVPMIPYLQRPKPNGGFRGGVDFP